MESIKLFSEAVEEVEYITEAKENGGKNYKIRGIFLQADIKNRNGRIYPMEVLEKEVNKYNKDFIEEKRAYGELGHPDGPTVNLERVSHLTTSLMRDGKNFIGEAKIMSTPMGEIVKSLMDEGCKLGVSSRGMGGKEWVWNNGALVESHLVELKKQFDVKERNRNAKVEALEFAKFLKRL